MFLKAVSIIYRGSIICIELGLVLGPGDVETRVLPVQADGL